MAKRKKIKKIEIKDLEKTITNSNINFYMTLFDNISRNICHNLSYDHACHIDDYIRQSEECCKFVLELDESMEKHFKTLMKTKKVQKLISQVIDDVNKQIEFIVNKEPLIKEQQEKNFI